MNQESLDFKPLSPGKRVAPYQYRLPHEDHPGYRVYQEDDGEEFFPVETSDLFTEYKIHLPKGRGRQI